MAQSTRDTENHLSPLHNNIVVCLFMIMYFKMGTEVRQKFLERWCILQRCYLRHGLLPKLRLHAGLAYV